MTENRGEIELFNQWFQIADIDRDGMLSGAEAVQFFLRSGLAQHPTLFKIWQYVAGDRPALTRQEFYTAIKLVSLAQANGGTLDDREAMRLVNGLAGPVPPPRLEGIHGAPPALEPARPAPAPPAAGLSPFPVHLSSMSSVPSPFPPLAPSQAVAFQTAFAQLDTNRDGWVQGVDCFAAFMQSGLPKATLKQVWDVVAGDDGQLNMHQFVQSLYLIECSKQGMPVPNVLPPGQFPPTLGSVNLGSLLGGAHQDIYSATLEVPPMVPKASCAPGQPALVEFPSQIPLAPAGPVAMSLAQAERARLEAEHQAAAEQEAQRKRAEEERLTAVQRQEFYTNALAELRLAQSKLARTLVEAQQRMEMEKAEAEGMEAQYNAAYEAFSAEHARAGPHVLALEAVQAEKATLAAKLEALRLTVGQLESFDPDWEVRERGECEEMQEELSALTVRSEELQHNVQAMQAHREELAKVIDGLKAAAEGTAQTVDDLKAEVDGLSTEAGKDGATAVTLLRRLAPLYNKLYSAAQDATVPLPSEALASINRPPAGAFKYDALRHMAQASHWEAFKDEGFRIASALPADARLEALTSASLVAAIDDLVLLDDVGGGADCDDGGVELSQVQPVQASEKRSSITEDARAKLPDSPAAADPLPTEDATDGMAAQDATATPTDFAVSFGDDNALPEEAAMADTDADASAFTAGFEAARSSSGGEGFGSALALSTQDTPGPFPTAAP